MAKCSFSSLSLFFLVLARALQSYSCDVAVVVVIIIQSRLSTQETGMVQHGAIFNIARRLSSGISGNSDFIEEILQHKVHQSCACDQNALH